MDKHVVLFIAGSGQYGSGEALFLDYLSQKKDLPFHPILIFPSTGLLQEKASLNGIEYVVIKSRDYLTDFRNLFHQPFSWVFNFFSFIKVSSLIRRRRVSLVVSLSFLNWTGALAARQEGIRHIWMIREILTAGPARPRFFWGKWLASRLANDLSTTVILESEAAASLFKRKRTREKAQVVLPGIDFRAYKSGLAETKGEKKETKNLTVFWGSWSLKRFRKLVSFLEQVQSQWMKEKYPQSKIEFMFPGLPAATVSRLQRVLSTASLEFEVKDASLSLEPGLWESSAVAIIIPGFDPLSRLVLQAGLARVPVLVDRGSLEELVINFQTGFIYEDEKPAEMSVLLRNLMEDKELREKVVQTAEARVINQFSLERWASEFEKIIRDNLV